MIAARIESMTLTPATVDDSICWECGRSITAQQVVRTVTGWQAIICAHCEPWVSALLGPIPPAGGKHRQDTV